MQTYIGLEMKFIEALKYPLCFHNFDIFIFSLYLRYCPIRVPTTNIFGCCYTICIETDVSIGPDMNLCKETEEISY